MELLLAQIASADARGIYGPNKDYLADRMRQMLPEAAKSLLDLQQEFGSLIFSDMFRSAEESLQALQQKSGVQPPGYSGHNFGLSFDVAVEDTLADRQIDYPTLANRLGKYNWYCHRRDGKQGAEWWHFNYLGNNPSKYLGQCNPANPMTWASVIESRIEDLYSTQFLMSNYDVQTALRQIKFFNGTVDGLIGPITMQAVNAFQRAWRLEEGPIGQKTQRLLAYVTATKKLQSIPV